MRRSLTEIRAFFTGRSLDLSFTIAALLIAGITYALIAWFQATAAAHPAQAAATVHAALFLIVFTGALLAPKWRYVAAAAGALTLPRFSALLLDLPTTRTLWPLFLGLAAALAVRSACRRPVSHAAAKDQARRLMDRPLAAALIALGVSAFLTTLDLYSPWILAGYPLAPYKLAPNVHAPLAMHAALTPLVNLGAPALFVLADGMYRARATTESADLVHDLTAGATLALLASLPFYALQIAGVARAFAGVLDASVAAGRAPGLFSDSGAATALVAVQLTLVWHYLDLATWLQSRGALRKTLYVALAALTLALAFWQGRLFAPALAWCLANAAIVRRGGVRSLLQALGAQGRRAPWLAAGALLAACIGALVLHLRPTPTLARLDASLDLFAQTLWHEGVRAALAKTDPVRAALNIQALQLWSETPWTGIGLNQFPVELSYRQSLPDAGPSLAIDSPPNLGVGLLLDGGIPAAMITLCLAMVWYGRLRRQPLAGEAASANAVSAAQARIVRAVQWTPLWLLPASLVGYQILHPEFAALCLLFWRLAPAPDHRRTRLEFAAAPAALFFAGLHAGVAAHHLVPAPRPPFWKMERRGGEPQIAADLLVPGGAGPALLFFYREREFALTPADAAVGAGPSDVEIILPREFLESGAQLYGECPGGASGAADNARALRRPVSLSAAADFPGAEPAESGAFLREYRLKRFLARLPAPAACGATLRLSIAGSLPKARRVFGFAADRFERGRLSPARKTNPG